MEQQLPETWMVGLKQAFEAGYYRTESATGSQTRFPWQGKSCRDCPFWQQGVCRVHAEQRSGSAHTCIYFDAPNHTAACELMESRMTAAQKMWWGRLER
jgi:hypothetical protein